MKKILLVEDEQFLREIYTEVLKEAGYKVTTARDGQEGYEEMAKGGYDLVLLDVMLPKLDGLEILKKLKKADKLKKNKAIFMLTNLAQEAVKNRSERVEVDKYLVKSALTPDMLVDEVKEKLGE